MQTPVQAVPPMRYCVYNGKPWHDRWAELEFDEEDLDEWAYHAHTDPTAYYSQPPRLKICYMVLDRNNIEDLGRCILSLDEMNAKILERGWDAPLYGPPHTIQSALNYLAEAEVLLHCRYRAPIETETQMSYILYLAAASLEKNFSSGIVLFNKI